MLRVAVEYLQPGVVIARDIYTDNGRVVLASGVVLTERHIDALKNWGVVSVYVENPMMELPPISPLLAERTRQQVRDLASEAFDRIQAKKQFELDGKQKQLVRMVVGEVMQKRTVVLHLAQMHRHYNDLLAHSVNVSMLAAMCGSISGKVTRDDLEILTEGAILHDIGKTFVPPAVLAKAEDALTPEEKEMLASHAMLGFAFLRRSETLPLPAAHIALQHHERFNGTGYPRRVQGANIHLYSRIVGIADAFDNLLVDRPGQPGLKNHEAYERIQAGSGTLFDPEIAKAFLSRVSVYPLGTLVYLVDERIGVVDQVHPLMQHRPVLRIIADETGQLVDEPYKVDLAAPDQLTTFIADVLDDERAVRMILQSGTG